MFEKELLDKLSYRIADGDDKDKEEKKLIAEHHSTLMWEKILAGATVVAGGVFGASLVAITAMTIYGIITGK